MQRSIGLVLPSLSFEIYHRVLAGVRDIMMPQGYHTVVILGGAIHNGRASEELTRRFYADAATLGCKGWIVYASAVDLSGSSLNRGDFCKPFANKPLVTLATELQQYNDVTVDNNVGMYDLTVHLLKEHQLQRVAFVGGPHENPDADARIKAWRRAHQDCGVNIDESLVIEGDFTLQGGEKAAQQLIPLKPQAIMAANDMTAIGVLKTLGKNKVQVPEACIVTGFDDFEYASATKPALTTVHYPARELGQESARTLLHLIEKTNLSRDGLGSTLDTRPRPKKLEIPARPVVRSSCGCKNWVAPSEVELVAERQHAIARHEASLAKNAIDQIFAGSADPEMLRKELASLLPPAGVHKFVYQSQNGEMSEIWTFEEGMESINVQYVSSPKLSSSTRLLPVGPAESGNLVAILPVSDYNDLFGLLMLEYDLRALDLIENLANQFAASLRRFETQKRLQEARQLLANSERIRSLGVLLQGVAHEMNTPLGSTITTLSFLNLISEKALITFPPELARSPMLISFVQRVSKSAELLDRNIKKLARLNDTLKALSPRTNIEMIHSFRLSSLVRMLQSQLQGRLDAKNINTLILISEDLEIRTRQESLNKVLYRLMENCLDHAFEEGFGAGKRELRIVATPYADGLIVRIRDNGLGIPKDNLGQVFDPFFTLRRSEVHLGLGLYAAHSICTHILNGTIRISSLTAADGPEHGTTVELTIPHLVAPENDTAPAISVSDNQQ